MPRQKNRKLLLEVIDPYDRAIDLLDDAGLRPQLIAVGDTPVPADLEGPHKNGEDASGARWAVRWREWSVRRHARSFRSEDGALDFADELNERRDV